jgi:hypothetical protein
LSASVDDVGVSTTDATWGVASGCVLPHAQLASATVARVRRILIIEPLLTI